MLRKDILDKYRIDPDEIRSIEDLEKVFDTVKKGEPGMTVLASGAGTMLAHLYFTLGGGLRVGAHMDYGRDDELVNLYETQEYLDALLMVRRWYMRGYLDQDILGQTEDLFTRVRNGELFAYTTKGRPGLIAQEEIGSGREMVCVQLGEDAISYNSISAFQWAITQKNTVSAEKSMKLFKPVLHRCGHYEPTVLWGGGGPLCKDRGWTHHLRGCGREGIPLSTMHGKCPTSSSHTSGREIR